MEFKRRTTMREGHRESQRRSVEGKEFGGTSEKLSLTRASE
jgi:hypothetical protein